MVSPATKVVLAENGDVIRIDEEGARVIGEGRRRAAS